MKFTLVITEYVGNIDKIKYKNLLICIYIENCSWFTLLLKKKKKKSWSIFLTALKVLMYY